MIPGRPRFYRLPGRTNNMVRMLFKCTHKKLVIEIVIFFCFAHKPGHTRGFEDYHDYIIYSQVIVPTLIDNIGKRNV